MLLVTGKGVVMLGSWGSLRNAIHLVIDPLPGNGSHGASFCTSTDIGRSNEKETEVRAHHMRVNYFTELNRFLLKKT